MLSQMDGVNSCLLLQTKWATDRLIEHSLLSAMILQKIVQIPLQQKKFLIRQPFAIGLRAYTDRIKIF
jgi:hypothetical protein